MKPCVIAVMTKAPLPGVAKTRLSTVVGAMRAAALHRAFLLDTLSTAGQVPGCDVFVVCPSLDQARLLEPLLPANVSVLVQEGDGLMAGLSYALRALLQSYRAVVLTDADSPTLPAPHLVNAFHALDTGADVVLGPCEDGGYYLIGATQPQPELFQVSADGKTICAATAAEAARRGLKVALLATWYDVDEPADLARLAAEVRQNPACARHVSAELAQGDGEIL
jgi:rSAM/selenodomain-associated transferase 1